MRVESKVVIGMDSHPDTFTAGRLVGWSPESAVVEKVSDAIPISRMECWFEKNVEKEAVIVLESSGNTFGVFDIVILGMGEDGHTASLFPDNIALKNQLHSVVPVHDAPKPPADRVSLSLRTIAAARSRIILTTGKDKQWAIQKLKAGHALPVNAIGDSDIFVDAAALS